MVYITSVFEDGKAEWTAAFPTFGKAEEETLSRLFSTVQHECFEPTPSGYELSEWKEWCAKGDQFSLKVRKESPAVTKYCIVNRAVSLGSSFMKLDAIVVGVDEVVSGPLWVVSAVNGIYPKIPGVYRSRKDAEQAAKSFLLSKLQRRHIDAPKSDDVSDWQDWAKMKGMSFSCAKTTCISVCVQEGWPIIRYNLFDGQHRKDVVITQCELEDLPF